MIFSWHALTDLQRPIRSPGDCHHHGAGRQAGLLDAGGNDQLLRVATAELRAALARYPDDPYLLGLIQDLTVRSPEFRERWEHCEVGFWRSAFKRIRHPERGWLDVDTGSHDTTLRTRPWSTDADCTPP
ncbi:MULTISPECIES: hypothetical protein [unclassified Pseudonocardia]|uniref:MmyB family transcriptional regulator n=1 Tax=unclassified Pseudonocardia TaxID=2619320 RepID=UPI00211035A2|nr:MULTISPECIES: hypothetical protein [unclassified Pseudonocardia]